MGTNRLVAVLCTALFSMPLGACGLVGSKRSQAAFCDTFKSESIRLHTKFQKQADASTKESSSGDPLGGALLGLGTALQAQGDLVVMFDKLSKVAPSEIEDDVNSVRDGFKEQADSMRGVGSGGLGGILGSMVSGLVSAVQHSGSYQTVDTYISNHCDLSFQRES